MREPNIEQHYIFETYDDAYLFYTSLLENESLSDEQKSSLEGPRQSHGNTWIIDRIKEDASEWQ